jgi:Leucine-rich repeat (LRR) protein
LDEINSAQLVNLSIIAIDNELLFLPSSRVELTCLARFSNLKHLLIDVRNINLPERIFKCLPNLELIFLRAICVGGWCKSQITCLNKLKMFHLDVDLIVDQGTLSKRGIYLKKYINKLQSIQILSLKSIEIEELDSDMIGNLRNLRKLMLIDCKINKIADDTFYNLKHLDHLDLSENTINPTNNMEIKEFKKKHKLSDELKIDLD